MFVDLQYKPTYSGRHTKSAKIMYFRIIAHKNWFTEHGEILTESVGKI